MGVKKTTAAAAAEPVRKPAARRRRKITHEMIEVRAYMLSLESAGSPLDDWLTAERELTAV
jgi:hypothetical protein